MKPNQFKNQLISNILHQYSNEFSLTNKCIKKYKNGFHKLTANFFTDQIFSSTDHLN